MPCSRHNQITVEKSANYILSKEAMQRIYEMNPDVKILIMVRDPTKRLMSEYAHRKALHYLRGNERPYPSFKRMLRHYLNKYDNSKNIRPFSKLGLKWVLAGCYEIFVREWLKMFRRSQMHIINGDLFISNPAIAMVELEGFLGLKPFFDERKFVFDKKKGFFCKKFENGTKECMKEGKGREHPVLSQNTLLNIQDLYRPHNKAFMQLTGMTFDWK